MKSISRALDYDLTIEYNQTLYRPITVDGVVWETTYRSTPGKLTFNVIKDDRISFNEGAVVRFVVNGNQIFYGFVFTKKRSEDQVISVTCYDQLRYLKNKDVLVMEKAMKVHELIQFVADKFGIETGYIEPIDYEIDKKVFDNETLFDIIEKSLEEAEEATGKEYVLYDDFKKLTLRSVEALYIARVLDEQYIGGFDYETSIDSDTYNQILLYNESSKNSGRETTPVSDPVNIGRWGVLQYTEKLDDDEKDQATKAKNLLEKYNKKSRKLSLVNVLGHFQVRAGASVHASIAGLGDINLDHRLKVDKARHIFKDNKYMMDLDLSGL